MKSPISNSEKIDSATHNRVLITGASGLIGSAFVEALEEEDIPFCILKRTSGRCASTSETGPPNNKLIDLNWPDGIKNLDLSNFRCLVHLALPPIKQNMSEEAIYRLHIKPLELLIARIKETKPDCQLVFVSSQSANSLNNNKPIESSYGRMKQKIETLIKDSSLPWTIIIPGLVYGESSKGLFGAIQKLIKHSPVVPVIGPPGSPIQPLYLWDLVSAMIEICRNPSKHNQKAYQLAQDLLPFEKFLRTLAESSGKRRIFIRPPHSLILLALSCLETLFSNPPFTKSNLLGFLSLQALQTETSWKELDLRPTPLDKACKEIHYGRLPKKLLAESNTRDRNLALECAYITKSIFGRRPNESIIRRYISAHQHLNLANDSEQKIMQDVIDKNLDIEALEFAMRMSNGKSDRLGKGCHYASILRRKMLLLIQLAEVDPKFFPEFITTRDNMIVAFLTLPYLVLLSLVKLIKGHALIRKHLILARHNNSDTGSCHE